MLLGRVGRVWNLPFILKLRYMRVKAVISHSTLKFGVVYRYTVRKYFSGEW